ncbi:MAG: hypothetical protein HDS75_05190 [Bacteroidales bacterium]|nr:hypothetical protein [Bacteroidales bacterium]
MSDPEHTILDDLLTEIGVKHTRSYTAERFYSMSFPTLFGLKKVLEEYGVTGVGLQIADTTQIKLLPLPFIAQTSNGMVIVSEVGEDHVGYLSQGVAESAPLADFLSALTGTVFLAFPAEDAQEPSYSAHRFTEWANKVKKWVLGAGIVALLIYLFVANVLYHHLSTIILTLSGLAGVYISRLLVLKSAHIKSRHADAVCSVVEAGGCDDILNTPASKFFGIFGWSEVGLAYFSVSLLCLLVFPQYIGYLAIYNLCCLPFSFWSVWYQRFKAKAWCTLCLCVQALLWLSFFCYAFGGWLRVPGGLTIEFFVLGLTYLTVTLGINSVMPLINRDERRN